MILLEIKNYSKSMILNDLIVLRLNNFTFPPPRQTRYFVDQRRVKFQAGSGGDGVCSFHSEPRKEWGGPDGGNGGNGGDIIIKGNIMLH